MYPGYDSPPQFGFTGSSMPGLPTTFNHINPMYYAQLSSFLSEKYGRPENARLASINGVELYDTLRVDTGALPLREFIFFQTPVGQNQNLLVAGTAYQKQEIDVHPWIVQGGQLALGYEALIWNVGVQVHIVQANDATLQAAGNTINLTATTGTLAAEVAADPQRMGNLMRAFQEGLWFEFFINQTGFENGPLWRFPAGIYGISGQNAIADTTTAGADGLSADGWANNGFGVAYQFPVMRHLPSQTKFGMRLKIQNSFTTPAGFSTRIVVTLGGIGIQPITG